MWPPVALFHRWLFGTSSHPASLAPSHPSSFTSSAGNDFMLRCPMSAYKTEFQAILVANSDIELIGNSMIYDYTVHGMLHYYAEIIVVTLLRSWCLPKSSRQKQRIAFVSRKSALTAGCKILPQSIVSSIEWALRNHALIRVLQLETSSAHLSIRQVLVLRGVNFSIYSGHLGHQAQREQGFLKLCVRTAIPRHIGSSVA